MKKMIRLFSLLLAVAMLFAFALADETAEDAVIATVNGVPVTYSQMQEQYDAMESYYTSNYGYDFSDPSMAASLQEFATEMAIQEAVMLQKATELGLDAFTEEEEAAFGTEAQNYYDALMSQVASYYFGVDENSSEEERADALAQAAQLAAANGITVEELTEENRFNAIYDQVIAYAGTGDEVTDEQIEEYFLSLVAEDEEKYANDIPYYEYLVNYYGYECYYTPAGYRNVIHLLLEADEAVLSAYNDLQATYEEQHTEGDELEEGETAVTDEALEEARLAVIASVQDKLDEINEKMANGTAFEDLIADYTIDVNSTKDTLFQVHNDSIMLVGEFVKGAMAIEEIGQVSGPVVSQFGVHLIKYVGDVPSGAAELTDAIRAELRSTLEENAENEAFTALMDEWMAECEIVYTEAE